MLFGKEAGDGREVALRERIFSGLLKAATEDKRIPDSAFRLLVRLSLIFGTEKMRIDDAELHRLEIKKSTFYRLADSLIKAEYLQRISANGDYRVTVQKMRLTNPKNETDQSQKWESVPIMGMKTGKEERTKEESIDKLYCDSNNNLIRDTGIKDIESCSILTESEDIDKLNVESKTILTIPETKYKDIAKLGARAGACARVREGESFLEKAQESVKNGVDPGKEIETERFTAEYREIIDYLNEKTGKHYSARSRVNQGHMSARLREGFTVEDFKRVIDVKCFQWQGDPKMAKFLRPETLFGTKFDRYLNEEKVVEKVSHLGERFMVTEDEMNSDVPF